MFTEIADTIKKDPCTFTPFSPAENRAAWENISETVRNMLIARGQQYLGYAYPAILITAFLDFSRTGNRVRFENIYFARRRALNALVMAECAEYKGRFMDDILNGVFALCEESAWQLPAHNSYERNAPQEPLPDVTDPVLDLFACETGAQLAMVMYLLRERFEKTSPSICKMINACLHHRIIKPYFNRHFWWMGNGDEPMCNWTVWCVQNMLIALFLTDGVSMDEKKEAVKKASYSIDCFLKDYGDDGCCCEGAGYYHHAGLCLFNAMEVLNAVTDNAFMHLYENEKIRNIALYIYNVHVDGIYFINYADCSPVAGRAGAREYLFAKRINSPEMMAFAASDYMAADDNDKLLSDEINLFYHVQNAFASDEIKNMAATFTEQETQEKCAVQKRAGKNAPSHVYYGSNGLFITRNAVYTLAAKAGCNDDSHNHNDTGSITLYKNGLPYLIDVGVESYTKKTFSDRRYEIWTMQSQYHNTPTFGGIMQKDGKTYRAEVLAVTDRSITMDIAGAYPEEARVKNYIRQVSLSDEEVSLSDSYDRLPEGSFMTFMTYNRPTPDRNGEQAVIRVEGIGDIFVFCINPDGSKNVPEITVETIPIDDERLALAWKHEIYRIKISLTGRKLHIHIQ